MKTNGLSLILVLTLGLISIASAQTKTFRGEIMDAACAEMGSHAHMMKAENAKNAKQCSLACVKTHGELVLYDAANKKIYKFDDPEKPKTFAGQKVIVTGVYDDAVKTIHVQSIKATVR